MSFRRAALYGSEFDSIQDMRPWIQDFIVKGSQGTSVRLCSFKSRWKALAGSRAPGVKSGSLEVNPFGASL